MYIIVISIYWKFEAKFVALAIFLKITNTLVLFYNSENI